MADNQPEGPEGPGRPEPDDVPVAAEPELLAAFDRLAPAGSHRWNFEESLGRLNPQPPPDPVDPAPPWAGLPADLWARGRSAQVGQRLVGDVVVVLAEVLAADTRAVARARNEAADGRHSAAWDALRFLAARLERLERAHDVVADLFPDLAREAPRPDVGSWAGRLDDWFPPPEVDGPVIHGDSGDGSLVSALVGAGYRASGIEPQAERVWAGAPTVVLGEVAERLAEVDDGVLAGLVLSGCIDRSDVPGKLALAELAVDKSAPGATVAVLPMDPLAWTERCPVTTSDLAPGRPFHPETWVAVLERTGLVDVRWHRPASGGDAHAVVGRRR